MVHFSLVVASLVSIILLGISAIYDLYYRKVPNYLTGLAAIIGVSLPWFIVDGISLFSAYLGGILGLLLFIPPYALGVMGAGDVKVLGVAGLFVGIEKIFTLTLYIAIAGGMLALIYLIGCSIAQYFSMKNTKVFNLMPIELPYVVAIFGGLFYMLIFEILI